MVLGAMLSENGGRPSVVRILVKGPCTGGLIILSFTFPIRKMGTIRPTLQIDTKIT